MERDEMTEPQNFIEYMHCIYQSRSILTSSFKLVELMVLIPI